VLGTEATVAREYTHALIRSFGRGCDVTLVGSANLARHCRAMLASDAVDDDAIRCRDRAVLRCRRHRADHTIVLACTHFPLLLAQFERLAPWPVRWIDPAPAIARRVVELIGPYRRKPTQTPLRRSFTSGRAASADLAAALGQFACQRRICPAASASSFDTPSVSA